MIVERRLLRRYPIGLLLSGTLGTFLLVSIIAMGVHRSFELTESGNLFPIVGLTFLLVSPAGFILALHLMRTGHNESEEWLKTCGEVVEIPFNRRPDMALLIMLLALLPEILLWISLADEKGRYFPGFILGLIVFFACIALWSAVTPRAPMIFDREGLQFAEFWRGKLLWRDLEASIPAGRFVVLVLHRPLEVTLTKRPWYKDSARWSKNGEALLLPLPLRYLSWPSLQRAIRERTKLKPVSASAVQRNEA
jgi:hypothetical protein